MKKERRQHWFHVCKLAQSQQLIYLFRVHFAFLCFPKCNKYIFFPFFINSFIYSRKSRYHVFLLSILTVLLLHYFFLLYRHDSVYPYSVWSNYCFVFLLILYKIHKYKTTHLRIFKLTFTENKSCVGRQLLLFIEGDLSKSYIHLCVTLLISVVLWTCKYSIQIQGFVSLFLSRYVPVSFICHKCCVGCQCSESCFWGKKRMKTK